MSDPGSSGVSLRAIILLAGAAALAAATLASRSGGGSPRPAEAPAARMPTRLQPDAISQAEAEREAVPVAGAYRREVARPRPVQNTQEGAAPADDAAAAQQAGRPAGLRRDEKKTLPEIFRMPPDPGRPGAQAPSRAPAGAQKAEGAGPAGAGTEAFSYAKPQPVIDAAGVGRLVDSGEWTLVLPGEEGRPNGRELILKARAVDRRESVVGATGAVRSWGIDDGADGLVGYTLSTLDRREIRLFAASAVSAMSQGLGAIAERQQPAAGVPGVLGATQIAPTLGNALAGSLSAGAADVMNEMAARIREEISRRGVYVRVPAGKPFYLFVEQTIDPGAAEVGLRLPGRGEASR
jgi:hypothetical protein